MPLDNRLPRNVDPGTLRVGARDYRHVHELYAAYHDQLVALCREMQPVRQRMRERGYDADFSDREAELLYLLIRDTRPAVVVEISPCHGYSTSYILAALTQNGTGKLFSYEITEQVNGVPTADVIRSNLATSCDQSRLEILIGDATKATIPDHDFLFLDSNHESWFAAWYFAELVNRPRVVFVHDIVINPGYTSGVLPKATFLGIREQYYVLQALHANQQPVFAVGDFAMHTDERLRASLPMRHERDRGDRSIVFAGHEQTAEAVGMHRMMRDVHEAQLNAIVGDRLAALACVERYSGDGTSTFARLQARALLPLLGYRYPTSASMFDDVEIGSDLTVSELVAALEVVVSAADHGPYLQSVLSAARRSTIDPEAREYLLNGYRAMQRGTVRGQVHELAHRVYHGLRSVSRRRP